MTDASLRVSSALVIPRQIVGDAHAEELEEAGVEQRPELPKAIQRQHQNCRYQSPKQLPNHVHKGSIPVTVKDHCWAEHSCWIQGCTREWATCRSTDMSLSIEQQHLKHLESID